MNDNNNGGAVEIHGPSGWWGKVTGNNVIYVVVGLATLASIFYVVHLTTEQNLILSRIAANQAQISENQAALVRGQEQINAAIQESQKQDREYQQGMIYVLSLSPIEREKLRLQMPDGIRRLERR